MLDLDLLMTYITADSGLSFCCAVFVQSTAECGHDVQWHRTGLMEYQSRHLFILNTYIMVERYTIDK